MNRGFRNVAAVFLGIFILSANANASSVAFFNNGVYVDIVREAPNLRTELTNLGHTANNFTDITQAGFSSALATADALLFPELERNDLYVGLSVGARTEIVNYVNLGGSLVIAGDGRGNAISLLNGLFGYSLTEATFTSGGVTSLQPGAAGTAFAGGPAALSNFSGTLLVNNLPGSASDIYSSATGTNVFTAGLGLGNITLLGYDWFTSDATAGWDEVLDSAITQQSVSAVPVPAAVWLFGTALIGFVGMSRRRKIA